MVHCALCTGDARLQRRRCSGGDAAAMGYWQPLAAGQHLVQWQCPLTHGTRLCHERCGQLRFVRRRRCSGDDAAAATLLHGVCCSLRCCACTAPCAVAMTPGTSELDVLKCPAQSILVVLTGCATSNRGATERLQLRDETALQLLPKFCYGLQLHPATLDTSTP